MKMYHDESISNFKIQILLTGESMKKGACCAKGKVLSKDCIFHVVVFY